jgi:hypothetical protein
MLGSYSRPMDSVLGLGSTRDDRSDGSVVIEMVPSENAVGRSRIGRRCESDFGRRR